jgi:hypothetical protein
MNLKLARLQSKADWCVVMPIRLLTAGRRASLTTYILTRKTRVTDKQGAISSKYKRRLHYLLKKIKPDIFYNFCLQSFSFWSHTECSHRPEHTIKTVSTSVILFRSQYIHSISRHVSVVINHSQVNHFLKTLLTLVYSLVCRYYPNL